MLVLLLACRADLADVRTAPHGSTATPGPTPTGTSVPSPTPTDTPTTTATTPTPPTGTTTPADALVGYVGSPCADDVDCPYAGGVCLKESEGFPLGTCSASCDQFCDDAEGYPTTFCAEIGALPPEVAWLGDGGCLSRCNFEYYPFTGCRESYGCVEVGRANDDDATYVCLPNVASDLSSCLADLAGRGVPFEPTIIADDTADNGAVCHVEEPISFRSGYLGVEVVYYDGATPAPVSGACSLGHALADTIEDVVDDGVTVLRHLGTYNCRTIAGSDSLSRHAYGDAIDIYGFDFANGDQWTLEGHWEHDTTTFATPAGEWLYDTSYGWYDQQIWNIVLTPNYNAAHDNHFHVDLTPGSGFIGFADGRAFGPSPWPGE